MSRRELDLTPFRFECTRCGKCCERQFGGVTLYLSDVVRLAKHFDLSPREFVARYCTFREHVVDGPRGRRVLADLRLRSHRNGHCVLLSGHSCSVHEVKPYVCAAAPFVFEIFSDPEAKQELKEICDGYGQGPEHGEPEFDRWLARESEHEREDAAAHAGGVAAALGIKARRRR
jgi:Fe-S-cluster containining protein